MSDSVRKYVACIVIPLIVVIAISTKPSIAAQSAVVEQGAKVHTTENKLVEADEVQRKQWSLSVEEWSRYKTLMKGVRGSISPSTISPIEVLGTHARNDQERKKYAEIWAQIMFEDAERVLAFQRAYNEAFKLLYGDVPLIDINKIRPQNQLKTSVSPDSRLLLFVKVDKCIACEQLIQRVVENTSLIKRQIDIYFVDTKPGQDDAKIQKWAVALKIDQVRLKAGKITLNHDLGNLYKITKKINTSIPIAFSLSATSLTAIKL